MKGLYAIVDLPHAYGLDCVTVTEAVLGDRLKGGIDGASVVQLRAKSGRTTERVRWLRQMSPLCRRAGSILMINDDIEAAIDGDADGLHLGQDDPGADALDGLRARVHRSDRAPLVIGRSTHNLPQLRAANRQQPDYVALGPIGPTPSKINPDPVVGFATLLDGCRLAAPPLVAIGGLDESRGVRAIELGAAAVAVIGALEHEQPTQIRASAIRLAHAFRAAAAPVDVDEVHRRIPILSPEQLTELAQWGDSLDIQLGLGLPARFRPHMENGRALYRPCDVIDLTMALGKREDESWDQWRQRARDDDGSLVPLRRR